MKDENRANEQLVDELVELRRKIVELEAPETGTGEAEELYRILAEKSFAGVYVVQDGMFRFINSNAAAYAGYTPTEMTGKTSINIVYPEDREKVRENAEKMLRGERTFPYEFRIITKDGYTRWIMETVTSIDYNGKPAVLGNSMDITESKIAGESLRESEQRLADIINFLPDATLVIDLEGKVVAWNRAIEEMTGVKARDILGKGNHEYAIPFYGDRRPILIDLIFESDEEIEKKYHFISKEKNCLIGETDVPLVKGQDLFLWGKASPIYDHRGNVIGAIESIRDITDRKRAEETLRESEEKYRTILENIQEGYFEVDLAGNLTFFNDSLCEILGYPRDELLNMNNRDYTTPETARKMYQLFNRVYRTGEPAKITDYEVFAKDGHTLVFELSTSLIQDRKNRPIGFRGVVRDTTDRKRAEEEKRELEASLQQARKMESIGILAGGIAHDFNNLLMGMQGNVSLMLLGVDPGHPHYEKLKIIEQHVQSGAELTSQLLGFARGGKYKVKPTDLNSLVRKSSEMFGHTKKEVTIHEKYQKDIRTVEADQGQMEQVLLNLYVNAWQAMPEGGDLYLQTENVTLDKKYAKLHNIEPGNYVKISVTDTGTGMDKATRQKIFDPFFTSKKMGSVKGTGLGLASAYGIIKNHGGIIDVYSKKGVGSTFSIYLPASEVVISDQGTVRE